MRATLTKPALEEAPVKVRGSRQTSEWCAQRSPLADRWNTDRMSRSGGGPYSRAEVDLLNARRDGSVVDISEITRVYRGNLSGVLTWFSPKPMPDEWAGSLVEHFAVNEQLVEAFGYPRDGEDFFVVHDLSMDTVVECQLPDDRIVPAESTPPPLVP